MVSFRSATPVPAPAPALVAVAHGTRSPAGVAVTEALVRRVRALRPGLDVRVGYLGLASPSLESVLAGLDGAAVLVPLLLGTGHHLRSDVPAAVAAAPWLHCRTAPALGPHPLLAEALAGRLAEAGRPERSPAPVVLAAAGSSDPAAGADTARMARLLALRLGTRVVPAHAAGYGTRPADAVAALRAEGHEDVSVATYLTAPGHFSEAVRREAGPRLVSAPLGPHEAVARLVVRRYEEAVRRESVRWESVRREAAQQGAVREAS
ncbi:sirohydrochlorin chelatase [Streptomyces rectiverticillatus]|uniref:sirohydrochlorin chelatase n=1 Tax=Streptomyces rectiverticillatus TaxID=173860 RepID=UPI0015C3491C|nr:CbiX/SirB N-terminal domain-containing protein [Streptomyces rectiverticillatus]QLE73164.1 sirohydrochlorin chelatase [Streptomyces rectiverticillatus]